VFRAVRLLFSLHRHKHWEGEACGDYDSIKSNSMAKNKIIKGKEEKACGMRVADYKKMKKKKNLHHRYPQKHR